PFDGPGRLAGDVVNDAGDAVDFVDDAAGHSSQQIVGQFGPAGGHEVHGFHGTQRDDVFVAATVTHDANAGDRQVDGKRLADLVVPVGCAQFFDENGVGGTQFVGVSLLDFAEYAYPQAR